MQISRPTAIIASLSTVSLGGIIGSFASMHDTSQAGGIWVFFGLVANFMFQVYRDHKQRRYMREDQERQAAREQRLKADLERQSTEIKASMRTRLSDLNNRLDRLVIEEVESERRRAEDRTL